MARPGWEELKKRLEFSEQKSAVLQKKLLQSSIEEDSTLWGFIDLITLLLILFVLFYSHAVTPKASEKSMLNVGSQAYEGQSVQGMETSDTSKPVAYHYDKPKRNSLSTDGERQENALEQLRQQVLQTVSKEYKDDFSVHWNQKHLVLVLGERITFNVGDADLQPEFHPTLRLIAEFIASQKGYKVEVAGHTDNSPINTPRFPSNWELSTARSVEVAKFLITHGVNPQIVSVEGYSSYRPLHPNTSFHNKRANRRVEITLVKMQKKSNEHKRAKSYEPER